MYGGEQQSFASRSVAPALNTRAIVYSVDFSAQAAGKRIATTKRRIRWRWGFANAEALEQGQTGIACRGEEHDVTLVWSVTSGKRQITMDGQEVHYSSSRSGVLDFSWTMRGNHILKLVAHANPPLSATPGFRQYDFFIDGQSFFQLPKVYELGVRGAPQGQSRIPGQYAVSASAGHQSQEEADLQRAIQESIKESRQHLSKDGRYNDSFSTSGGNSYPTPSPAPQEQPAAVDLLDFGSTAPGTGALVPATPQYGAPDPAYAQPAYGYAPAPLPALTYDAAPAYAPVPAPAPAYAPAPTYPPAPAYPSAPAYPPAPAYNPSTPNTVAEPPQYQQYPSGQLLSPGVTSTASAPPAYGFPVQQPMHSYDDPFAPKAPTQNEMLTSVLGLYSNPPSTPTTPGAPPQPNFQSPSVPPSTPNGVNLTMNAPLTITQDEEDAPKSAFDKALSNLVNFDDISAPADKDIQEAMKKKLEEQKRTGNKSKPLPPAANNMVGSGATLAQISQVKPPTTPKDPTAVMKPPPHMFHQDAAMAGALVIRGAGPPPLQPQGFGIVHGQGYYGSRAGY